MSNFYFDYKRIILIDSADLCYAEIPLNQHAILLGKGNVGKSSILNSLRLFLLPEVNFSKCERKFAFKEAGKSTYYSKDESFQHYFPSVSSFLILEVENFTGSHCQILHKEKGYQYRRIFVPLPYDQLRDLFWFCCDDDKGIGQAVEGLTVTSVLKQIKKRAPESQVVRDPEKLKQLLYASNFVNESETRYSLFPLIEQGSEKVDSLRALFLLLFDMNSNDKAMSTAIANIIEAENQSSNDLLDFNIDDFLNQHEDLEKEEKHLIRIEYKEIAFKQLRSKFQEYSQLSEADKKYAYFLKLLSKGKQEFHHNKKAVDSEIAPFFTLIKKKEKEFEILNRKISDITAQIKIKKQDWESAQRDLEKGSALWQQFYVSMSIDEAINSVSIELKENRNSLRVLNSDIEIEARRKELESSLAVDKEKIEVLQSSAKNKQFLLSAQLSDPVKKTLAALNKRLLEANPQRILKSKEIEAIEHFISLFSESEDEYYWFNIPFFKQSTNINNDLNQQFTTLQDKLKKDGYELDQLKKPTGSLYRQKDIQDLQIQCSDLEERFNSLSTYRIAESNEKMFKSTLDEMQIDKLNQEAKKTAIQAILSKETKIFNQLKFKQDSLADKIAEILNIESKCNLLEKRYPRLQAVLNKKQLTEYDSLLVTKETVDEIDLSLQRFDKLRNDILTDLRMFIHHNILDDEDNMQVDSPDTFAIKNTFKRLEEVFSELPQKREILASQVVTHNGSVSQYTHVLGLHATHIEQFTEQLNRDFDHITINNLEKVEVNIEIDRRFKNLVAEINKVDLYSDTSLSERFYDRLKDFVKTFFKNEKNAHLTMDKVVTGLHYRIQKKNSNNWQSKSQSNSTTSLINLELALLLLKRIKMAGSSITFPLVYDELASINIDQFDWLLSHLKEQGFRLFAAATHNLSAEVIHKVKNYHEIGSMRTDRSYSAERTIVYWGGAEKFLDKNDVKTLNIAFSEQSNLSL